MTTGHGPIDTHAHLVPPGLLDEVERNPRAFPGVGVERTPAGPVLSFEGMGPPRPIAPKMLDAARRPGWLAEHGLSAQVCGTWIDATGDSLPPEAQQSWCRRFNEELSLLCKEAGGQLRALAVLPVQAPEAAARELEYAVERLGMVGAMLSTHPTQMDLASEGLAPLWDAAVDLGVAIVLHPGVHGPASRLGEPAFMNLHARTVDTTYTATRLILSGLFDRHPEVRVVLVHGGGFLAYQAHRLDACFQHEDWGKARLERERPSEYLGCFHYDTALLSPPAARMLVETVGTERVMLGTDYPFPIADAGAVERLGEAFYDPTTRQRILHGNAARCFGLEG